MSPRSIAPRSFSAVLLAALLLAAPPAAAGVLLVDPSGDAGANFQAAIDAAADGDTLVLLPGDYSWPAQEVTPHVHGKGLTIVPAAGSRPHISTLHIANVPAGSQVVVRGIDISTAFYALLSSDGGAVFVDACAGPVWLEDCALACPVAATGQTMFFPGDIGYAGAKVRGCAAVNFVRCQLTGGQGATQSNNPFAAWPATRGGHGAKAEGSSVTFHDCVLKGGEGGHGLVSDATGAEGGAGLDCLQSQVLLAGCTVNGGDKALLSSTPGDGVLVEGGGSTVFLRGTMVTAGDGLPLAQDVDAPAGSVETFAAPPRSLDVTSPLHEGELGTLVIGGQPGDLIAIFVAFSGAEQFLPGKQGAFLLGSPLFGPLLLAVNPGPTGEWTIPFTAGPLVPATLVEQTFLLQLVVHDGTQVLFEGTSTLTVVDATIP
jgi:hypothetical protein